MARTRQRDQANITTVPGIPPTNSQCRAVSRDDLSALPVEKPDAGVGEPPRECRTIIGTFQFDVDHHGRDVPDDAKGLLLRCQAIESP